MNSRNPIWIRPALKLTVGLGLSALSLADPSGLFAATSFLGVASGDASTTEAVLWTRALDASAPGSTALTALIAADDPTVTMGVLSYPVATDPSKDYTAKVIVSNLLAGTRYYYRFAETANPANLSGVGTFKTAPEAAAAAAVKFGFSGDADGLMRPYALAHDFASLNLDFFMWCGDTIYETASSNSPAVAVSGSIPAPSSSGATSAQLFNDYSRKYREQFLAVNAGGQECLKGFFAAQGNYTLYDNHELGNRQYINGGAPQGGPVGDMPAGAGVDARDPANDVNTTGLFMNKTPGFQILQRVYLNYQPVREWGLLNTPSDPRTDGTPPLFFARRWGHNVLFVNTDDRTYRDIRIKTAANADDSGPRAGNPARTMLGSTQLAWLKQTLLDAQNAGAPWKFVTVSDPIDQLGPIGGSLSGTLTSVNSDGGKSWMGGYRAERNDLLKFIADNHILNVVFLATDDHQNRINEMLYSPTGDTELLSSYRRVPHCISIVDGPLGATGPDTVTNHTFANLKAIADSLATAQSAAGVDPIGLDLNYPGLFDVVREGDPAADTLRQPFDFYSPDTFNYTTFEISADGGTLSVKSWGISSTAVNTFPEYDPINNPVREILSFSLDAAPEPAFATCPDTIVVANDPGLCSAVVALPLAATGRPEPVVTCTAGGVEIPASAAFPKGTTSVTCTASNVLGVATCAFTVTVVDSEAPSVTSRPAPNPSGMIVPGAKQNGFVQLLSRDNCDPNPRIFVKDSASGFVAGPFASGDAVKISIDPSAVPAQKKMGGAVEVHIIVRGAPLLYATDADGNSSVPVTIP